MRKALSIWKVILIVFASVTGVVGATSLGLYLSGSLKDKIVEPKDMAFSHKIDGKGFYDTTDSSFKLSSDSKLKIVCTTKDVTETEVSLSLENEIERRNGYISDGVIRIPETVQLNSAFTVQLEKGYYDTLGGDWIKGSEIDRYSVITAKSQNIQLTTINTKVVVDVPVSSIAFRVPGEEQVGGVQSVVIGSVLSLEAVFSPENSKYLYTRSGKLKDIYYEIVGGDYVEFNEATNKFTAKETGEAEVTGYAFSNSYYQIKYFENNPDATYDQIITYLSSGENRHESVSNRLTIKVEAVEIESASVSKPDPEDPESYMTISAYVDKEYTITANSSHGDRTFGVTILNRQEQYITSLYGRVAVKVPQDVEGFSITGGRVVKVVGDVITIEDYDSTKDYSNPPANTSYYILPNTRPSNTGDYFWKISSSKAASVDLEVSLFYEKDGTQKMDAGKVVVTFAANTNNKAVGWKDPQSSIKMQVGYDRDGNIVPYSVNISNYLDSVDSANTYKLIKYFIYADTNEAVDLTEFFSCNPSKEYSKDYRGENLVIEGVMAKDSYALYELNSSVLTALKSCNSPIKVIAAIVRTLVDGTPSVVEGKYEIVAAGRGKEVVVDSSLSISMMKATYRVDTDDELVLVDDNGVYYIPSVRMDGAYAKPLIYLDFTLTSTDIENDVNKLITAYSAGTLKVVCLDSGRSESEEQYITLESLDEVSVNPEENKAVFVGAFSINSDLIKESSYASEGVYVGLQLEFTEKSEIYTKTICETGDELEQKDHFYIYRQIATPDNFEIKYVEEEYLQNQPIYVNISVENGAKVRWKKVNIDEPEGWEEVEITDEDGAIVGLQKLLTYKLKDQKENDIDVNDGMYKIRLSEVDEFGNNVTSGNVLSFSSDSTVLSNFIATAGVEKTTYLKVIVVDENGDKTTNFSDVLTFIVRSEGLSKVEKDDSTVVGEADMVEAESTSEITVSKLVYKGNTIMLSDLFKIYVLDEHNDDKEVSASSYTIKFDQTFIDGLSATEGVDLMKMLSINGEGAVAGDTIKDKGNVELETIGITTAFNKRGARITFNIIDNNGLYVVRMNLWFLSNIDCESGFNIYTERYQRYLQTSAENPNAISVFAGETYALDTYLKFKKIGDEEKYKWSTAERITIEEPQGTGIVSLNGANLVVSADVYQGTLVTFTLHYDETSQYAFSVTCTLYVVPNIALVKQAARPFVDLSAITASTSVSNFYHICKLTDYVKDRTETSLSGFTYSNVTENRYIKIESNGKISITDEESVTLDYELNNTYSQTLSIQKVISGTNTVTVDAVIVEKDLSNVIISEKGQTKFDIEIGYYSSDPVALIESIVQNVKVIKYNGNYQLLLVYGTNYNLLHDFKIDEVNEMSYINDQNKNKLIISDVDTYFADGQYVIVKAVVGGKLTVRLRLDAVVTKLGDILTYYTDANNEYYDDYGVLLGNEEVLEEHDIYQELVAGQTYDIVHDRSSLGYTLIESEGDIDWTKTYYVLNTDGETYRVARFFYYDGAEWKMATGEEPSGTTYYIQNEDEATYTEITAAVIGTIYKADCGIYVDTNIYNRSHEHSARLEIVEDANGYISNLATTDGVSKITFNNMSVDNEDVYVVLKYTVFFMQEGRATYSWYYRIKVVGNYEKGQAVYPYSTETEYLETSSNYYHVLNDEEAIVDETGARINKYYEINFNETFDERTLESGKKRFEFDFDSATTRTQIERVVANGTVLNPTEKQISGVVYYAYSDKLLTKIDENVLRVYLKDSSAKYTIVLKRTYYKNENILIGSEISYTIKINEAPEYDYEVVRKNGSETRGESLTARNGEFETTIVAGGERVTLETSLYKKSNGTRTVVPQYNAYVYGANDYIDNFVYEPLRHKISFTPKNEIAQNGSFEIGFYDTNYTEQTDGNIDWSKVYYIKNEDLTYRPAKFFYKEDDEYIETTQAQEGVTTYYVKNEAGTEYVSVKSGITLMSFEKKETSLVAFKIVVKVESFYRYEIVPAERTINSGEAYNFEELFNVINTRFVKNTSGNHDWNETYYAENDGDYEEVGFYYLSGTNYIETDCAIDGVSTYYYENGDGSYVEVNATSMANLYIKDKDVTNETEVSITNATEDYGTDLTFADLFVINNTNHTVKVAYLEEDIVANFQVEIAEFTFTFDLTIKAQKAYSLSSDNSWNDTTIRYSDAEYSLETSYLDNEAGMFNGNVDEYFFAITSGGTETLESSVLVEPAQYELSPYVPSTTYTMAYSFNGKVISRFNFVYRYTVLHSISVNVNYPDPDETGETDVEYYKNGSGAFKFTESAIFAGGERIAVTDVAAAVVANGGNSFDKTWKIDISEITNVRVSNKVGDIRTDNYTTVGEVVDANGTSEITLRLVNTGMEGRVTFTVSVNNIISTYTFVVITEDVFNTNLSTTNYVGNQETIYAEDLSSYGAANQNLFENDRILKFTLSANAEIGRSYFVRLTKGTQYKIVEINENQTGIEINRDMGKAYKDYVYQNVYSSSEYAQAGGEDGVLQNIFSSNPVVTGRITFTYKNGRDVKGSTAYVENTDGQFAGLTTSDFKTRKEYSIKLRESDGTMHESSKNYALYLTSEFGVENAITSTTSETVQELDAGTRTSLLDSCAAFGIVNTRYNVSYSTEMLAQSEGLIELHIYGFEGAYAIDLSGDTTPILKYYHNKYGLKPRAGDFEINNSDSVGSLEDNYISMSAIRKNNDPNAKIVDYMLTAQGAKNEGNYVMMQLKYKVAFGAGEQVSENYDILFLVNPNSRVWFIGKNYEGGDVVLPDSVTGAAEFGRVAVSEDHPFTIKANSEETIVSKTNSGSSGNVIKLYNASNIYDTTSENNAIVANMYGNTGSGGNNISTFTTTKMIGTSGVVINGKVYNDLSGATLSGGNLNTPSLAIGVKYYYVDFENKFNYKIRVYIKLIGDETPDFTISSETIKEGYTLAFGSNYNIIAPQTTSAYVNNAQKTIQVFTKAYNGDQVIPMKFNLSETNTFEKEGGAYLANGTVIINASGWFRNDSNEAVAYSGSVYKNTAGGAEFGSGTTEWRCINNGKILYTNEGLSNQFSLTGTEVEFILGVDVNSEERNRLSEIVWCKGATEYPVTPVYSQTSTRTPVAPAGDENPNTLLATFSGISANAFETSANWDDISAIAATPYISKVTHFTVEKVEFIYKNAPIGTVNVSGAGKSIYTDSNTLFYDGTALVAGANYVAANNSIKIPYVDGSLYGTSNRLSGVTMRVTLKYQNGATTDVGTIDKLVTLENVSVSANMFVDKVVDGDGIKLGEGIDEHTLSSVLNDTLEVDLEPGKAVTIELEQDDVESPNVEGTKTSVELTNNTPYKKTEYVSITQNFGENLKANFVVGDKIKVSYNNTISGVTLRYNSQTITNGGCLTYAQYQNGKIKLHVFDMSELSTTLTSTSCVNRTLYFVYTNKYSVGSGTETRTYQHNHEFSVYPKYYTADSTYRNEQGQIVLPIDDFAVHTNESDVYYVIPFTKWADKVTLLDFDSATPSKQLNLTPSAYFRFEINNDASGGGAAFIDETGTIYTFNSFDISSNYFTVNMYMKASGTDDLFDGETETLIGQFRMYLRTTGTPSDASNHIGEAYLNGTFDASSLDGLHADVFYLNGTYTHANSSTTIPAGWANTAASDVQRVPTAIANGGNAARTFATLPSGTKFYCALGETENLGDNLDSYVKNANTLDSNESNIHYHVLMDNATSYYSRNLDTWTFAEEGNHSLKILVTYYAYTASEAPNSRWSLKAFIFEVDYYVYNESAGTSLTYVIVEGDTVEFDGVIINASGADNGLSSKTFNETGLYEYEVVNVGEGKYTRYSIYVYNEVANLAFKKTPNQTFALSKLGSAAGITNISAYYYIDEANEDIPTQVMIRKTQETEISSDADVLYLAQRSDNTYFLFAVRYIVIGGNVTDRVFAQVQKGTNLYNTALSMFQESASATTGTEYQVYRVENASTELLKQIKETGTNAEIITTTANLVKFIIRVKVEVSGEVSWYNYSQEYTFYVYDESIEVDVEAEETITYALSNANAAVLEELDVGTATIKYFTMDTTSGDLIEKTYIPLEDLTTPVVQNYYISVTTNVGGENITTYYKLKVTFSKE